MLQLTSEIRAHSPDKALVVEGLSPLKVLVFSRWQLNITLAGARSLSDKKLSRFGFGTLAGGLCFLAWRQVVIVLVKRGCGEGVG